RVEPKVGPDVAGSTVRACDVGGHAFDFGRDDAGRREGFADDGSAVCLVLGERLVGPVAGDLDASTAEASGFPVVRPGRALFRDQAGTGVLGLDAVAELVRAAFRA